MPALIEPTGETRRPRRPSFTQQLQRMLHIDKPGDTSKSGSHEDSSIADFLRPTQHLNHSAWPAINDSGSGDYSNHGPSVISRHSHSSLGSKVMGLNSSESRHSSLRSFHFDPQQPARASPVVDDPLRKQDVHVSPTASHGVVQKKDRRATKRLEAERLELEKRLLKLEEAERAGNVAVLRRESRRLTKKQPLGSSSRSSSVSGDESRSRPPSRLSSIFSSSRRRSRSRSSSIDGVDNARYTGSGEAPPNDALPSLSSTLPERLSTAISKELAARKNAMVASPKQSTQSLKLPGVTTEPNHSPANQPCIQNRNKMAPYQVEPASSDVVQREAHVESEVSGFKDPHQQADLDKALFTASLTSKKRNVASSGAVNQATHHNKQIEINLSEVHTPAELDQTEINSKSRSTAAPRGSSTSMLARASTDGVVQRHQKKFKSSPLTESQTVNGDDVPSSPKRATTLASPQASDPASRSRVLDFVEKVTRSELIMTSPPSVLQTSTANVPLSPSIPVNASATGSSNHRSFMSKIPTSKPNHPIGGQPSSNATLAPPRQKRASSPSVPPKSPKRNSRAISQSPEPKVVPANRLRPTSSLSASASPDSESDYNTADEAASIISNASNGEDPAVSKQKRTMNKTRAVSKKEVPSSLDGAPVPAVPFGSKTEMKEQVKKARPVGPEQLVAKLFVICCRCKFWHDMPSEAYASLTNSDPLSAALDQELVAWEQNALSDRLTSPIAGTHPLHEPSMKPLPKSELQQKSLRTRVTADLPPGPVKCCWCEHHMSKQCCQGWATVVHMRQRHH
ncbi:hypothetical protein BDW59DRAFT_146985 [Aspergillus cavernicola]|uniref:Uncharacterized protein n=1 Tax=Aspergillus cavernicola TaxID=176166 RepID=A0ABR4IAG6_9EURO